jgi:hypothetical protein
MTDRERWTVYPLLLLSLAISVRDKMFPPRVLKIPEVQCQQLQVIGPGAKPLVALGASSQQAGIVELMAGDGRPKLVLAAAADGTDHCAVQLLGRDGKAKVTLGTSDPDTGRLQIFHGDQQPAVVLSTDIEGKAGAISTFVDAEHPQVLIGSIGNNGIVTTLGADQKKLIELSADSTGAGVLMTYAGDDRQVVLDSASGAGRVGAYGKQGRPVFVVTHDEQGMGRAVATDSQGRVYLVLMASLATTKPAEEAKPQAPLPPEQTPRE